MDTINMLTNVKLPGIDKIPRQLIKHGGYYIVKNLTVLRQKAWTSKTWLAQWMQSLVVHIPKKCDLKKCKNYITLSLIYHSSNILLKIMFKRLNPQVDQILSDQTNTLSGFCYFTKWI